MIDEDARKALHAAVKEAYDAGLCVVPPREDGSKAPEGYWGEFIKERASIEILRDAYRNGRHGIGLVCGAVSGQLECLDFDTRDIYGQFKAACGLAGLDELLDRMEEGYSESTPNGHHLLYRPERCGGCQKLARTENFETLIEVKAEGGYIIVSPTYGPVNPGGPYVRLSGSAATIPFISMDEREALYRVATTFDRTPRRDDIPFFEPADGQPDGDGNRPGDDFIRRGSWDFLADKADWKKVAEGRDPEGRRQEFWRRPGKDQGNSAILHPDSGLFYVFSTSTAFPFVPAAYNKFRTLVFTCFDGDFKAATAYVKSLGFKARKDEPTPPPPTAEGEDEFGGLRGDQIFELEVPDIEHLPILGQDGFVMRGAANLLYAFPKAGKTELTASLLREWLYEGLPIVYLSEEPLFFWKERFEVAGEPPSFWAAATFYPAIGWGVEKTLRALSRHRGGVLVIDTLRNTLGYQESKGDEDVARVILPIIAAARGLDMTLVALYHARKMPGENGTDISGHHSLYGAFDRAIQLRRIDGEENDRKRRLVVSGRLLDPMGTTKMTYILRDNGSFEALDVGSIVQWAKVCEECGKEFKSKRSTSRFDSPACRLRAFRKGAH